MRVGDVGDGLEIRHIVLRIAYRLQKNESRIVVDELRDLFGMVGIEEAHLDAKLFERLCEESPRASVEAGGGNDVLPRMSDGQDRRGDRGLAARKSEGRRPAFERRHALLEHVAGGIPNAGIDIPEFFEREEIRGVVAIVEDETCGGVNRHGPGVGGGIGFLPGVKGERGEAMFGFLFWHKNGSYQGAALSRYLAVGHCCVPFLLAASEARATTGIIQKVPLGLPA